MLSILADALLIASGQTPPKRNEQPYATDRRAPILPRQVPGVKA
jgi:hypothetical protein